MQKKQRFSKSIELKSKAIERDEQQKLQIQPQDEKLHGDFSGLKEQLEITQKKIIQTKKEIEKNPVNIPKNRLKNQVNQPGSSQTIPTQSKSQLEKKMIHEKEVISINNC